MSNGNSKKTVRQRRGTQQKDVKKPSLTSYKHGPFSWLIIAVIIFTAMMILQQWRRSDQIRWDEFVEHVENKHIRSAELGETQINGRFNQGGIESRPKGAPDSFTVNYNRDVMGEGIEQKLRQSGAEVTWAEQHLWLTLLLSWVLPLLVFLALIYFFFARPFC